MTQYLAHKIRLYPNDYQVSYFKRACGIARHAYNWGLAEHIRAYKEEGKTLTAYDLNKTYNAIKKEQFPWTNSITKYAPQIALHNVIYAFNSFFKKSSDYPKFKAKKKTLNTFAIGANCGFTISNKSLFVPKLGKVKMAQELRFEGKQLSCTISQDPSGEWFASINVELPKDYKYPHTCENQAVTGIDLGFTTYATLSNGTKIDLPKPFKYNKKRLTKAQRKWSRSQPGSNNREKARIKVAKIHRDIKNQRKDNIHKLTTKLVEDYSIIGIEDLNLLGIAKLLGKSSNDAGFGMFRTQIEYKAKLAGSTVVVADRFFASSKLCSCCGAILSTIETSMLLSI